jgi:hypothetical protein
MGRLDLRDPYRDEDAARDDVLTPTHPEIGSDAWTAAEIKAGRSGEEHDD